MIRYIEAALLNGLARLASRDAHDYRALGNSNPRGPHFDHSAFGPARRRAFRLDAARAQQVADDLFAASNRAIS